MGSNISREGITRDLEALKAAGFNRTTMFSLADATTPPLERPILFHHLELLHQRLAAHSLRPARPGDDFHHEINDEKSCAPPLRLGICLLAPCRGVARAAIPKPAGRRSQISLRADSCGTGVTADGSDIIPVVATFTDKEGLPKRLTDAFIKFEVEGEGTLIDDERIAANPQRAAWGEAVALVRTTEKPGKIKITASGLYKGANQPQPVSLVIESQPARQKLIYSETPDRNIAAREENRPAQEKMTETELQKKLDSALQELNELKLKEVEDQQAEFAH